MKWPDDYINKVIQGDCLDVMKGIPIQSIDLIITDPPYIGNRGDVYRTYRNLSAAAEEVLKYGGFCYAYCGSEFLPVGMNGLNGNLTWYWLYNIKHNGGAPRMWNKRLMVTSKPVIVCTNGKVKQDSLRWGACDHDSEKRVKEGHEWGQSPGFAIKQIGLRTNPGDIVLDPFLGSGTTAIAALQMGRRFIGIEIDPAHADNARKRIAQASEQQDLFRRPVEDVQDNLL